VKEASTSNKRKAVVTEETECQSEVSIFTLWYGGYIHAASYLFVVWVQQNKV
jgi:hypothetical protein